MYKKKQIFVEKKLTKIIMKIIGQNNIQIIVMKIIGQNNIQIFVICRRFVHFSVHLAFGNDMKQHAIICK